MFSSKNLLGTALTFGLAILFAAPMANAAWISPVDVPYASPDYTAAGRDFGIGMLYDGVYGSSTGTENAAIMLDDTASDYAATGCLVFDLGSATAIDGAKLWSRNISEANANAFPKDVDFFYFADDDPSNNTLIDDIEGDADIIGLKTASLSYRVSGDAEEVAFGSTVAKRYIGLRLNDSWDTSTTVGERGNHIQEAMFSQVPEPSALILITTGVLGLLCYAWRKRK